MAKDVIADVISGRYAQERLDRAEQRVRDLESLLRSLCAEDQGFHDDPEKPVEFVRLSTVRRQEIEDILAPNKF